MAWFGSLSGDAGRDRGDDESNTQQYVWVGGDDKNEGTRILAEDYYGNPEYGSPVDPTKPVVETTYLGSDARSDNAHVQAYYDHVIKQSRPYRTTTTYDGERGSIMDVIGTKTSSGKPVGEEAERWERYVDITDVYAAAGRADIAGRRRGLLIGPELLATRGNTVGMSLRGGRGPRQVRSA